MGANIIFAALCLQCAVSQLFWHGCGLYLINYIYMTGVWCSYEASVHVSVGGRRGGGRGMYVKTSWWNHPHTGKLYILFISAMCKYLLQHVDSNGQLTALNGVPSPSHGRMPLPTITEQGVVATEAKKVKLLKKELAFKNSTLKTGCLPLCKQTKHQKKRTGKDNLWKWVC